MFALIARGRTVSAHAARPLLSYVRLGRAIVQSAQSRRNSTDVEAGYPHTQEGPGAQWLTTSLPEITPKSGITTVPWEPKPVYVPLSSLLVRQPGHQRACSKVVALEPSVFDHPIRRDILHLCVVYHRDALRQGTAANKNRAEVSGSGKKLRPQKGTGRARLGDRGNPMLRGGGRAFAKKARDFSTSLPRKMQEMGMRVALSAKMREQALGVVESLEWPGVKTGEFKQRIGSLGWKRVLFIHGASHVPENLRRSSSNLRDVHCTTAKDVTVYDLLKWQMVVLDIGAVDWFHQQLGKKPLPAENIGGHIRDV
ncbi:ribosomal protein L4 [Dacryopinax primogenitus]|uniref:Large ribosomal subunit protein uL4m n=1 Tax=Dacryopinax primogenitus (strain DJM 731) TaxID=1858805 RepID=M5FZG3_DACPD|nr:ribosomal protein L4 [Dacryopinax primogenitus]EJU01904.1 ribosomal protein L4 [Dacryopinax primogenitus]